MANISEHDSEEKWEGDHVEDGWVGLLVVGNSVSAHDLVERCRKLVHLEVGWRLEPVPLILAYLLDLGPLDLSDLICQVLLALAPSMRPCHTD